MLNADGVLDRTRYDRLFERFLAEDAVFVLDSGATAFLPFWSYLVEADLIGTLGAAGRSVYVHVPIAGGEMLNDTLLGFKTLAETASNRNLVVWINEYFGPVARYGKAFKQMQVYLDNQDKVLTAIAIPQGSPDTFGQVIRRQRESTLTEDWGEAQKCLRERLQARDNNTLPALRRRQDLTFGEWSDFYLENFSKPPFRAPKTHEVNQRALKHLRKVFENSKLAELTADDIEMYLRRRLKQRALVKTKEAFVEKHVLKATTVHQELRVLRAAR